VRSPRLVGGVLVVARELGEKRRGNLGRRRRSLYWGHQAFALPAAQETLMFVGVLEWALLIYSHLLHLQTCSQNPSLDHLSQWSRVNCNEVRLKNSR
jgi:hypothetical protein